MKKGFIYFNEGLCFLEGTVASLLSLTLLVAIFWQVICRYILLISTPWAEELGRYMFIGISYIGAGLGVYRSQFVTIDLLDKVFEWTSRHEEKIARRKLATEKVALVVSLIFLISFGYIYFDYFMTIAHLGQRSPAMRINMLIPLSFVLIGTICMAIHAFCLLITSEQERETVRNEIEERKAYRKVVRNK